MSIEIKVINENTCTVNGKRVFKDQNDLWIASVELTTLEKEAFQRHINLIKSSNNPKNKNHESIS